MSVYNVMSHSTLKIIYYVDESFKLNLFIFKNAVH